jgi:hypothetical protein
MPHLLNVLHHAFRSDQLVILATGAASIFLTVAGIFLIVAGMGLSNPL